MSFYHELYFTVLLCVLAIQCQPGSCCSNEEKNSHLWQIGTNPPSYLFGTLHVPYNKLWDTIPDNVKAAFGSSEDVFVELDWADESTSNAINNCQLLPHENTVDMYLSARVFQHLKKYMRKLETKIPRWYGDSVRGDALAKNLLDGWERKRPIWLMFLLSSLNKQNVRSTALGTPVLDVFLSNAAFNLGKTLKAMENADDQCNPFNKLSTEQEEYILKKELEFLDEQGFEGGSESTGEHVNFYTCGDFDQMIAAENLLPIPIHNTRNKKQDELVKGIAQVLTTHMVVKRNKKMAKTLLSSIKSNPTKTHFFAVGAGHMVGNNSVIDFLRRRGVDIVHLPSNATISGNKIPKDFESLGKKRIIPERIDISTLFTTQPTPTVSTNGESTDLFNAYDILDKSGTTRPTYAMTLGPFFTMPTTFPVTVTTPTSSPTTVMISTTTSSFSSSSSSTNNPSSSAITTEPSTVDVQDGITASNLIENDAPLQSGASTIMSHTNLFRTLTIGLIIRLFSDVM